MTRARISLTLGAFVLGLTAVSTIGYAQTGRIKGKVVDAQNKPVEGARLLMESKEMNRKLTTKTDKRGEYTQFLPPGDVHGHRQQGQPLADLPGQGQHRREGAELHAEARRRRRRRCSVGRRRARKGKPRPPPVKGAFEQGVALSNESKFDEAIAKFNEVLVKVPKCVECQTNIARRLHAEEGLRPGRGRLQEGARDQPELELKRTWASRTFTTRRRSSTRPQKPARRRRSSLAPLVVRRGRCQRLGDVQPGRHRLERGQDSRGAEALRTGRCRRPEDGRSALLARHGERQPGQAPRSRQVVRGIPEARRQGTVRRTGQGHVGGDQEVVGSGFRVQGSGFSGSEPVNLEP